ncbi:hypothetical protein PtB15_7B326 [Puccinia triticina]|nr:hypothetical protein PtB15_7B326 [Puccinia triticina]
MHATVVSALCMHIHPSTHQRPQPLDTKLAMLLDNGVGPEAEDHHRAKSGRAQHCALFSHPPADLHYSLLILCLDHLGCSRTSTTEPSPAELSIAHNPDLAAGLPIRPSWQLDQLSTINYPSILKSSNLLEEVLVGLDLEDSP